MLCAVIKTVDSPMPAKAASKTSAKNQFETNLEGSLMSHCRSALLILETASPADLCLLKYHRFFGSYLDYLVFRFLNCLWTRILLRTVTKA